MTRTSHSPVETPVDPEQLREQVREKYREVAREPGAPHHFHTGRRLAHLLGYPDRQVDALPDTAVESFAGVANPFSLRALRRGDRVVDVGSGAGFDSFVAAQQVGPEGSVVGVDMTDEMLEKARRNADRIGFHNVDFRVGLAEALPVSDESADVVISNGVFNLCADKREAFEEIMRILAPGGWLQFADIANGKPISPDALRNIDLWTG
ncbi:MAG TPA: methyltransferase domain-containing protein [Actinomycetota bacterium]|nr:methyltransferase domain-containing protein [Actinomycetota bacterium]